MTGLYHLQKCEFILWVDVNILAMITFVFLLKPCPIIRLPNKGDNDFNSRVKTNRIDGEVRIAYLHEYET